LEWNSFSSEKRTRSLEEAVSDEGAAGLVVAAALVLREEQAEVRVLNLLSEQIGLVQEENDSAVTEVC